jgi:hypothetical protein
MPSSHEEVGQFDSQSPIVVLRLIVLTYPMAIGISEAYCCHSDSRSPLLNLVRNFLLSMILSENRISELLSEVPISADL